MCAYRRKKGEKMRYSKEEIIQYIAEEDVKFIRMAFCDIYGRQKNISIMPQELGRAFEYGIAIDASAIAGFGNVHHSDLLLHPDTSTLSILPWRPEHGRVVRMFCSVSRPDNTPFEADTRAGLIRAVEEAKREGVTFSFGTELEFYLFKRDENDEPTKIPYDNAGYMDIAPEDKGENVRREICLTLEKMGITPESSHHEDGPGQNEIDFRYSDPITAADNAITFRSVVNTIAARNGLYADFSPKPLEDQPGNGMHINISVKKSSAADVMPQVIAGTLEHIRDMTIFMNTTADSYLRFGSNKAPKYVSWSSENRSQLIRIPAASGEYKRAELRSPDPLCNPYLAFTLLIQAGLDGIRSNAQLPPAADINLYNADDEVKGRYTVLPQSLEEARRLASESSFISKVLPKSTVEFYTK